MSPGLGIAPNGDAFHHSSRRSQTPPREPLSAGQLQAAVEQDLRASPPEAARDGEQISLDADPVQKPPGSQGSISEHINTTIDTIENEKEQADGREPGLPITPTKNVLEGAEPRLPPTPSQLGLEAPSSSPKGLSFCRPSRKLKRKKRSQVKSSPLKPRDPSPVMKSVENPPPSGLGPRIPVTSTQQSKTTQPQGRRKYTDRPYVQLDSAVFSLELTRHLERPQIQTYMLTCHESHQLSHNALLFSFHFLDLSFQIQTYRLKTLPAKKIREPSISTQPKTLFFLPHAKTQLSSTRT